MKQFIQLLIIMAFVLPASAALALPNLQPTPRAPYGPYLTGQMPMYQFNLRNTGPDTNGMNKASMNSNWVVVDAYSNNNYPSGKGPEGAWLWVSADSWDTVPAASSTIVNNGGQNGFRWPDNDWCVPAGTHRVKLEADHDNDLPETSNSDNTSAWTTFTVNPRTVPTPDLTVTAPASFGPFVAGQTATFPFTFRNIGTAAGTPYTKAVLEISLNNGTKVWRYMGRRPALSAGESVVHSFTWPTAIAGVHTARVKYVDHAFEVDELNDCNNTSATITFTVLPATTTPANLVARATPRTVSSGQTVTSLGFDVRNPGGFDIAAFPYRLLVNGTQVRAATSSTLVPALSSWQPVSASVSWTAPTVVATTTVPYQVQVTDPVTGVESTSTVITVVPLPGTPHLIICPSTLTMNVGENTDLRARYWTSLATTPDCTSGGYSDMTNLVDWSSNKTAVTTVTNTGSKGRVSAVTAGTSSITAWFGPADADGSLTDSTSVTVTTAVTPITLELIPRSRFVRFGSATDLDIEVNANVALDCTITGGMATPVTFSHTAASTTVSHGPYRTKALNATQSVTVECINPINSTERDADTVDIEVVPVAAEV